MHNPTEFLILFFIFLLNSYYEKKPKNILYHRSNQEEIQGSKVST
jgi:hypothetical protein